MHFTGTKYSPETLLLMKQKNVKLAWRIPYYCSASLKRQAIKLTHYDNTEKRAHDSEIVRAKENLKLSHGGHSYGQASGTSPPINALRQSRH